VNSWRGACLFTRLQRDRRDEQLGACLDQCGLLMCNRIYRSTDATEVALYEGSVNCTNYTKAELLLWKNSHIAKCHYFTA
jgi:hypothetical protein